MNPLNSESEHGVQTACIPCFLAIGCGGCEAADGTLWDGGTALACPEWCGGLSLEGTVCNFCLTKPPAGTVKEELHVTILWSSTFTVCKLIKGSAV